jgi:hypothetical protein
MPPNDVDSLNTESLKGLVLSLLEQNRAQQARIDELLARIAELEGRAGKPPKTPTNSSVPPSRGQKANVAGGSGKKGRKGRPGVTRELCPTPDVTRNIYVEGVDPAVQVLAHAYDHVEIPPTKPVTTRVNLFCAQLPCGKTVTAEPPADMPPSSPRLAPASSRSSPIFTAARWSGTPALRKCSRTCSA